MVALRFFVERIDAFSLLLAQCDMVPTTILQLATTILALRGSRMRMGRRTGFPIPHPASDGAMIVFKHIDYSANKATELSRESCPEGEPSERANTSAHLSGTL